jgi:hypothetical protein
MEHIVLNGPPWNSKVKPLSPYFLLAAVFVACVWLSQAQALAQTLPPSEPILRCEYAVGDQPAPARHIPFPDGDLFRPLLADPKEPRTGLDYRLARADPGSSSDEPVARVATLSAGGTVGIWAHKVSACHGVQVSLVGAVFSQFDMDAPSRDLINSDFVIGTQLAMRAKRISGRVRLLHQSSHLGEDFIHHNPPLVDANFGFLTIDGIASFESVRWRAYGGGGWVQFQNKTGSSALAHAGAEFRAKHAMHDMFRPVAGIDVTSLQSRAGGVTTTASGGLEWTSPAATRRMRGVLVFTDGYSPYGQAWVEQKIRTLGLQFQIEF